MLSIAPAPPPSSCTFGNVPALGTAPGMSSSLASASTDFLLTLGGQGQVSVGPSAGGPRGFSASAAAGCLGPYGLVLQPTGNLVLVDHTNRSAWHMHSCGAALPAALPRSAADGT
jgi:hypothetical protein